MADRDCDKYVSKREVDECASRVGCCRGCLSDGRPPNASHNSDGQGRYGNSEPLWSTTSSQTRPPPRALLVDCKSAYHWAERRVGRAIPPNRWRICLPLRHRLSPAGSCLLFPECQSKVLLLDRKGHPRSSWQYLHIIDIVCGWLQSLCEVGHRGTGFLMREMSEWIAAVRQ